ncbi:MAG TPA: 4Fe-4S dicluster domain-containing protein [Xanthobacteraceae bacterium]|nr:4Fe-4S dicluster domain-containing protein [Xanthobacteraceae bacterium]
MNRFVIADPKLCIGCYTCEAACVHVHQDAGLQAYPRLAVTQTAQGTMPVQCRHCEDAPCATVCPVNAITQAEGMIALNESTCIGCKMCALACPFGAIEPHGTSPMSQQLLDIFGAAAAAEPAEPAPPVAGDGLAPLGALLQWSPGVRTVAVKCDLCYFRADGPKCIEVCPTKALHLVDNQSLAASISAKRRQTVAKTSQALSAPAAEGT